jgi:hypothetical protein
MNLDSDHVLFWMDAIRNSKDQNRTLEAFWKGQVNSKLWLIENLRPFIKKSVRIDIHGGWVGVLASLLFQSSIPISRITSVDLDPECETIAYTMNKLEEIEGRFTAITSNMIEVNTNAEVVINTSCEHITQADYETWLNNMPKDSILVLQSNNYIIPEHVRNANSLEEFRDQSHINVLWAGEKELPKYTRYMLIGKKN